jgi:hypothetical protein
MIEEYSLCFHVSAGDPPVYLSYREVPAPREEQKSPTHSSNFGTLLKERCDALNVPCSLSYNGAPGVENDSKLTFILATSGLPVAPQLTV